MLSLPTDEQRVDDSIGDNRRDVDVEPKDIGNRVYMIFFLLGAGILFPWNVFITAVDYFDAMYPSKNMDLLFGALYMAPNLIALCFVLIFGNRYSNEAKIFWGFVGYLVAIVATPLVDAWFRPAPGQSSSIAFYITTLLVAETGVADAVAQGSLYGMAGSLPPRYTQALMAGTSGSGFLVSVLRVITKACLPSTLTGLRMSATIYFIISFFFVLICLMSFLHLPKTEVVQYYMRNNQGNLEMAPLRRDPGSTEEKIVRVVPHAALKDVAASIWPYATMVAYTYMVTLAIFPGYVTENFQNNTLETWYPVLLITAFNLGDLIGKIIPSFHRIVEMRYLVLCTMARTLFIPFFWFCGQSWLFLGAPWSVFSLVLALGWTNGYFGCLLMMVAPGKCSHEDAELAGTTMVFSLVFGLTVGAFLGWAWHV